jgi:chorismate mutase
VQHDDRLQHITEDVPDLVVTNDHKSLSPMDIVAVLTAVTKDEKAKVAASTAASRDQQAKMAQMDAEIAVLRESLSLQAERLLQMEMAFVEFQRVQAGVDQLSLAN